MMDAGKIEQTRTEQTHVITCDAMKQVVLTVTTCDEGGACVEAGGGADLLTIADVGCDDEGPPAVPDGCPFPLM
jgi:hypothetical protein